MIIVFEKLRSFLQQFLAVGICFGVSADSITIPQRGQQVR
jgi:hypothetical protein